jgi:hypothetical protein
MVCSVSSLCISAWTTTRTTTRRGTADADKDDMSSFKSGDRVLVHGGTYKYNHAKFIKNAGAFSAKLQLESTGEEKKMRRRNLRNVSQQQTPSTQPQQRNTAVTSGAPSKENDNYDYGRADTRSEVATQNPMALLMD